MSVFKNASPRLQIIKIESYFVPYIRYNKNRQKKFVFREKLLEVHADHMPNLIIRGFEVRKNNKGGLLNTYIMILIEKIIRNFKNFSKILHNKTPCTMERNFVVCGHPYIMRNAANNYVAKIKIKNSSPLCQCNKKLNYMCCVTNVYIYIIVPRSLCPSCQYYCN